MSAPAGRAPAGLPWLLAATVPFALANAAFDVLAPLWAVEELALGSDGWARLRSLRMLGTCLGIVVLALVAERFGARRSALVCLGGAGLALVLMVDGADPSWAMPVLGALISAVYVGFNSLVQVSSPRVARANGAYRGTAAGVAVVAPALAATAATAVGGYAPVLAASALLIVLAALPLLGHPGAPGAPRAPLAALRAYAGAARDRALLGFVALDQLCAGALAAVSVFAAIRCTRDLGLSTAGFGLLATGAGALGFLAILAAGALAPRVPPARLLAGCYALAGLGAMGFGLADGPVTAGIAFAVVVPALAAGTVPASIGIGERAGAAGLTAAFTLHKLVQSGGLALVSALLAVLEPRLGMRVLIAAGGAVALLAAPLLARRRRRSVAHAGGGVDAEGW